MASPSSRRRKPAVWEPLCRRPRNFAASVSQPTSEAPTKSFIVQSCCQTATLLLCLMMQTVWGHTSPARMPSAASPRALKTSTTNSTEQSFRQVASPFLCRIMLTALVFSTRVANTFAATTFRKASAAE
eukprot:1862061-Prymnesium_polylepis.1